MTLATGSRLGPYEVLSLIGSGGIGEVYKARDTRLDGRTFLVMEYLEGETLEDRLTRGPLPVSQALRYAIEIAGALDHAHRAHVVHRDIKPSNVMLTATGAKGTLTPRESEYRKTRTDDRVSRE